MKTVDNKTQPLTAEERLSIALSSGDNESLVREAVNYVQTQLREKYPSTSISSNREGEIEILAIPSYLVGYTLTAKTGQTTEPVLSFWRNKPVIDKQTGIPKMRTYTNYEDLLVAKLKDREGCRYNRLIPQMGDQDVYQACQEVTKLTHGRIRTQI